MTASGYTVYPDANYIPADLPEAKLPCLFVQDSGGYAPGDYVPTERPTYQIIIKGKSYKTNPANMAATEGVAKGLVRMLHRRVNYEAGSTHVFSSTADQQPIYLGLDAMDRPMYSTNFIFYVKEATTT
nr:minor capsid protein [Paenibacillus forsythiae]